MNMNTKNSGYLVKTKNGKRGRTIYEKGLVKGKIPVYLEQTKGKFDFSDKAILCDPKTVIRIGFID